jgi:phage shock protein PspC (stress-responsive transcriptional regulator)
MKKALNISLSGVLFTIEDDAYAKLDEYLQTVRQHFDHTEGKNDIIADIENRIAEQFTESGKRIITLVEVNKVIASMGKVEDFDDGEESNETAAPYRPGRKLYRDSDDIVIAGVASGLGAYFGIDAVWMRIIFILLTLSTGFGILLYIILWIITPKAMTASEKLEMRGSPITLGTLSGNTPSDTAKNRSGGSIMNFFAKTFAIVRKVIVTVSPFFRLFIGLILAFVSIAGVLALSFAAPSILMNGESFIGPLPLYDVIGLPLLIILTIGAYIAIVIPLLIICTIGMSLIRNKNLFSMKRMTPLFVLWCAAFVISLIAGSSVGIRVESYATTHHLFDEAVRTVPIESNIESLRISRGIKVVYVQGEEKEVEIRAATFLIDRIDVEEENGTLNIGTKIGGICFFCHHGETEIIVTLPALTTLEIRQGSQFETENWMSDAPIGIKAHTGSRVRATIATLELSAHAFTGSQLEFTGTSTKAHLIASQGSSINAAQTQITETDAEAYQGGSIIVGDTELTEETSFGGTVTER